jgi:RHS repeat-associated protein
MVGPAIARPSFAAWGARRGANWQGVPSPTEWQSIADSTRRGFTGHEHLDNVMLVHMNGRVYDPGIGRFLSADPFIDCAEDPAGWNRYSYVKNRPLSYTDPSGYASAPIRGFSLAGQVKRIEFGPQGGGGGLGASGGAGGAPSSLEEILVTAGPWPESLLAGLIGQLAINELGRGLGPRNVSMGGGGGPSGGDAAKQREEEFKHCMNKCMDRKVPYIVASTAAAAAATTGNIAVTVLVGGAAFLAGVAQSNNQGAFTSLPFSAAVGHVAAMFDQPSPVGVFVSGPVAAVASDLV